MAGARIQRAVRALNAPAIHFAAIGVALFLASQTTAPATRDGEAAARPALVIDAARVAELRREYTTSEGEAPDAVAVSHIVDSEIDDELLYREALRLGLDRADRTVFWRLVDKMKFLGEAREGEADEEVFRRALAMRLQEKDPVIRRVLIRKLGMLIRFAGDDTATETELRDYYERHPALYARPQRVSLVHVFFSSDARGERTRTDAERALEELRAAGSDIAAGTLMPAALEAVRRGDAFLGGHVFARQTRESIAKLFGDEFAGATMSAAQGEWQGPIRSAYGYHLVSVRERIGDGRMPLESVRSQVNEGVLEERRNARLAAKLVELRTKYDVRVEAAAPAENRDA